MSEKEKQRGQSGGPQFSNVTTEQLQGDSDDDDDEEGGAAKTKGKIAKKGGSGRRRIDIKFIENKSRRQVTFSRRKRGLMKKVRCNFLFAIFSPQSHLLHLTCGL
jgi:hypothetical protein